MVEVANLSYFENYFHSPINFILEEKRYLKYFLEGIIW